MNLLQRIKLAPKRIWIYSALAIILALVSLIVLDYLSFYFHELGHAISAILYTFSQHEQTITINFTYIPYKIPYTNLSYLVPQRTIAKIPNLILFYGVVFNMILYAFIVLLLSKIKRIKQSKKLELSVSLTFILLIIRDIILNLFCGTDGFKLSCSQTFIWVAGAIFYAFLILSLSYFFTELLLFKLMNPKRAEP